MKLSTMYHKWLSACNRTYGAMDWIGWRLWAMSEFDLSNTTAKHLIRMFYTWAQNRVQ